VNKGFIIIDLFILVYTKQISEQYQDANLYSLIDKFLPTVCLILPN